MYACGVHLLLRPSLVLCVLCVAAAVWQHVLWALCALRGRMLFVCALPSPSLQLHAVPPSSCLDIAVRFREIRPSRFSWRSLRMAAMAMSCFLKRPKCKPQILRNHRVQNAPALLFCSSQETGPKRLHLICKFGREMLGPKVPSGILKAM